MLGTNVETKADIDDGPPLLLPLREDEDDEDILVQQGVSKCR
jgi:hypothetical protein